MLSQGVVSSDHPLQQEEVTAERRAKREEAFVAPEEDVAPTIEEKRKRKHSKDHEDADGRKERSKKKRKKEMDNFYKFQVHEKKRQGAFLGVFLFSGL